MKRNAVGIAVLISVIYISVIGQRPVVIKEVPMGASDALVSIGLQEKVRKGVAQKLNILLANEYTLYIKTQKYHWNVVGPLFGPLHKLFNDQYDELAAFVDLVAERIRALGYKPYATLAEFIENTTLSEDPGRNPDANGMITKLLQDHETVIKQIRLDIDYTVKVNDMGTNNFLADLIEKHEKTAWILRVHLL